MALQSQEGVGGEALLDEVMESLDGLAGTGETPAEETHRTG